MAGCAGRPSRSSDAHASSASCLFRLKPPPALLSVGMSFYVAFLGGDVNGGRLVAFSCVAAVCFDGALCFLLCWENRYSIIKLMSHRQGLSLIAQYDPSLAQATFCRNGDEAWHQRR